MIGNRIKYGLHASTEIKTFCATRQLEVQTVALPKAMTKEVE